MDEFLWQEVKGMQTRGQLKIHNVGELWERKAVHVAGPFPKSARGNKYVMVIAGYFRL